MCNHHENAARRGTGAAAQSVQQDADVAAKRQRPVSLDTRWFSRLRAWAFGYDAFISYRHLDGLGYAMALEHRLAAHDFAVFRDVRELPAGTPLEEAIWKALARSRLLIVIATPRARDEQSWVAREIAAFPRGRPITAIRFDAGSEAWPVLAAVQRKWIAEDASALEPPQPTDSVVEAIEERRTFLRVNVRARLAIAALSLSIVTLGAGLWHATRAAAVEGERARFAAASAASSRFAAESEALRTATPSKVPQSIAAALRATEAENGFAARGALRRAVSVTAPLLARQHIDCSADYVAWSEHTIVVAGRGGAKDVACVIDVGHAKPVRTFELSEPPFAVAVRGRVTALAGRQFGKTGHLVIEDTWNGTALCPPVSGDFDALGVTFDEKAVIGFERSEPSVWRIAVDTCNRSKITIRDPIAKPPLAAAKFEVSRSGDYLVLTSKEEQAVYRATEKQVSLVVSRPFEPGDALPIVRADALVVASGTCVEGFALPAGDRRWAVPSSPASAIDLQDGILLVHARRGSVSSTALGQKQLAGSVRPIGGSPVKWGGELSLSARNVITIGLDPDEMGKAAILWDRMTGSEVGRMFHTSWINAVLESAPGSYVTIGADREVRWWGDIRREEVEIALPGHVHAIDPDGSRIAVASGTALSVWGSDGVQLANVVAPHDPVMAVALFEDQMFAGTSNGLVGWSWNRPGSRPEMRKPWSFKAAAVTFDRTKEGTVAVAIDGHGRGVRYNTSDLVKDDALQYRNARPNLDALMPRDSRAIGSCDDRLAIALLGGVAFAAQPGGAERPPIGTDYQLDALAWGPHGSWLVLPTNVAPKESFRNPIPALEIIWNESGKRSRVTLAHEGHMAAIAVDPSGQTIAIGIETVVQIWAVPEEGADPQQLLHQFELPWAVQYLRYASAHELWVGGETAIRRFELGTNELANAARRRLLDLLPVVGRTSAP